MKYISLLLFVLLIFSTNGDGQSLLFERDWTRLNPTQIVKNQLGQYAVRLFKFKKDSPDGFIFNDLCPNSDGYFYLGWAGDSKKLTIGDYGLVEIEHELRFTTELAALSASNKWNRALDIFYLKENARIKDDKKIMDSFHKAHTYTP